MWVGLFNMDEYNDLRRTGVSVVTDDGFIRADVTNDVKIHGRQKEKRQLKMSRKLPLFFDSFKNIVLKQITLQRLGNNNIRQKDTLDLILAKS